MRHLSARNRATNSSSWLAILSAFLFLLTPNAWAAGLTLAWDQAPNGPDPQGYYIDFGENEGSGSGHYTERDDVGNNLTHTVSGLTEGKRYCFAAKAYANGDESGYSNEVCKTVASAPEPEPVAEFTVTPTSGVAPLTVTFEDQSTGDVTDWSWNLGDDSTENGSTVVKTYPAAGTYTISLTVTGPGGSNTITKNDLISVTTPDGPVADFSADLTSGPSPLTVNFTNASTGNITGWSWDFGDGNTSADENPTHTYNEAGTYTVTLEVTGPGGTDPEVKSDYITVESGGGDPNPDPETPPVQLETGEVELNEQWQRVTFNRQFVDPVVVAKPLSANDPEPAVVRIRNVGTKGFDIRIQEWEYLDQVHGPETVGYLAMERGSHTLEDGTQVEAGQFKSNSTTTFQTVRFSRAFSTTPVVLSAVTSFNESDAVASRMGRVTTRRFKYQMQEQEANQQSHLKETVSYIAWPPSSGIVDGVVYEVNRTGDVVRHKPYRIQFKEMFAGVPVFLGDMQTRGGRQTANLRWQNKDLNGVEVYVAEEQSKSPGTRHTTEVVGYMAFSR